MFLINKVTGHIIDDIVIVVLDYFNCKTLCHKEENIHDFLIQFINVLLHNHVLSFFYLYPN